MRVRILGSAAGGGYPQWNCACASCVCGRSAGPTAWRTQDSLAVSGRDGAWYLLNASPDVRVHILTAPDLTPGPGLRQTPLRGVLLTSAELDHTLGLAVLREGARIDVYATAPVLDALTEVLPLRRVLAPYADHRWHRIEPRQPYYLEAQLRVTAVPLSAKRPRYATGRPTGGPWVVAYRIEDLATGGTLVYAPNLAVWPPILDDAVADADCVIVDGTFWSAGELSTVTGAGRCAAETGHLPVTGPGGVAERLAGLPCRRILTHMNNTNPVLNSDSPERAELATLNLEVAVDGMVLQL